MRRFTMRYTLSDEEKANITDKYPGEAMGIQGILDELEIPTSEDELSVGDLKWFERTFWDCNCGTHNLSTVSECENCHKARTS